VNAWFHSTGRLEKPEGTETPSWSSSFVFRPANIDVLATHHSDSREARTKAPAQATTVFFAMILFAAVAACRAQTSPAAAVTSAAVRVAKSAHDNRRNQKRRISVLFASPVGTASGNVDINYLRELAADQFDVDYTETLDELTWPRLQQYNVIVVTTTPDALDVAKRNLPSSPSKISAFTALLERYLRHGGGVLLFPNESNALKQAVSDLTDRWGARLPAETIVEHDSSKITYLSHARLQVAYTDEIAPSPVTQDIHGLWYPVEPAYFSGMTAPIIVDDKWQVVVRASRSATTQAVRLVGSAVAAPNLLSRDPGVHAPDLVAIREHLGGRIGLINQWQQFTFGAGTRWLYNREVLDKGLLGKPSGFDRLFRNLLKWLAEPSLNNKAIGNYSMPRDRLAYPNERAAALLEMQSHSVDYDRSHLDHVSEPEGIKLYRGLIGAQTVYSGARGTVDDYARTARSAGLDFVVFLDRFDHLSAERFHQLERDCTRLSDQTLALIPGFTIDSNIGNHFFFFSPDPAWPPDIVLTGPNKQLLNVQQQAADGSFTGYKTEYLEWVLSAYQGNLTGQVGLFDFSHSEGGVRLPDARLISAAAVSLNRGGASVEDLLTDYLAAVQSTSPPSPFAVSIVRSPAELTAEIRSGRALTFAPAVSLDTRAPNGIFRSALRWSHQYDALPVFASSGPSIVKWSGTQRSDTYGAEGFSPERAVVTLEMLVTSSRGLREIRIYDGQSLFRRFRLAGETRFERRLILDGAVQKDLVLIATDARGGRAVSSAVRAWAGYSLAPEFCSDHVNDCKLHWLLAHGPYSLPIGYAPSLPSDIAGATWDGGPLAVRPLDRSQETRPSIQTNFGVFDFVRSSQQGLLDFSDEGAVGVTTESREPYSARLRQVLNPWNTWGPIDRHAPAWPIHSTVSYRAYASRSIGPTESEWPALGQRAGTSVSALKHELCFDRPMTVNKIRLASFAPNANVRLAVERSPGVVESISMQPRDLELAEGSWFGLFSEDGGNAQLVWNRGPALRLVVADRLYIEAALNSGSFRVGDVYRSELATLSFPLDVPIARAQDFAPYVDYLRNPAGLNVLHGQRLSTPGLLEVAAEASIVELRLPRASSVPELTLPLRISGLNPNWSALLLQREGYVLRFYGSGTNRVRGLGVEPAGFAYVPLYVGHADQTWLVAGHPVTADDTGRGLVIQATALGGDPFRWHVSVNNPTGRTVTTQLHNAMGFPGINLPDAPIQVGPGAYLVIQ
jgi:hypothetical protein